MSIKAILYQCLEVGKNIKSSKKRYIWKFRIDDKEHTIDLFVSMSGKKKVVHNGRVLREESSLFGNFNYSMTIQNNMLTLYNTGDLYDLRINNMQFSYLFHNEKTKKEFQFEDGYKESKDEDYNKPYNSNQRKTNKPLVKNNDDTDGYDLGIADGFEQMAPKPHEEQRDFTSVSNPNTKLNIRFAPKPDPYNSSAQKLSPPVQKPIMQPPPKKAPQFADFGNFGTPIPQQTTDNVFGNFGNFDQFKFEQPQPTQQPQTVQQFQQFGNPFDSPEKIQQPQVAVVKQEPPKPKAQETNLIDFMDDTPVQPIQPAYTPPQPNTFQQQQQQRLSFQQPVQSIPQQPYQQQQFNQQQQQQQQKKQLPQDLLDEFDRPPSPPQNLQPPLSVNITQLYNQPQIPIQQPQLYQQVNPLQKQQIQQVPATQVFGYSQQQQPYLPNQFQQQQQTQQQQYQLPQQQYQQTQFVQQPVQVNVKPMNQSTPFDDLF